MAQESVFQQIERTKQEIATSQKRIAILKKQQRALQEKRLIKAARKAGMFSVEPSDAALADMFEKLVRSAQKYPMADSIEKQQIRREQQKLHRAELHLARLKTKIKKARQTDARMKLRLGNLAFLTNWEKMGLAEIEQRIIQIKSVLEEKNDHTEIRQKGQKALDRLAHHPEKKTKSGK